MKRVVRSFTVLSISACASATCSPDPRDDPKCKQTKDDQAACDHDQVFNANGYGRRNQLALLASARVRVAREQGTWQIHGVLTVKGDKRIGPRRGRIQVAVLRSR